MCSSETPTASICIRGFRPTHLEEAIRSVLDQSFEDLEVVVSDDGDVESVIARFDDPRVRYHRNPTRLGVTGNTRAALNLARGRFIGLLGDDDRLFDGYLAATVGCLQSNPDVGVVFTDYHCEENGVVFRRNTDMRGGRHDDFLPYYLREHPVHNSAALMRREVWERGERSQPIFDEAAPDLFVFTRAAQDGWPFFYIDRPLMIYRLHEEQTSRQPSGRTIATWEHFRFDDPECESLRRRALAEAHIGHANSLLMRGDAADARVHLRGARAADAGVLHARRIALTALAHVPFAYVPARAAWRSTRRLRASAAAGDLDRAHPVAVPLNQEPP